MAQAATSAQVQSLAQKLPHALNAAKKKKKNKTEIDSDIILLHVIWDTGSIAIIIQSNILKEFPSWLSRNESD